MGRDTKFKLFMSIYKNPLEPDTSITLTGSTPGELVKSMETLASVAKTTELYSPNDANKAEPENSTKEVLQPQQISAAPEAAEQAATIGVKGLTLLRCPSCNDEFTTFFKERTAEHECRKCGAKIQLSDMRRFEFTCPKCGNSSYGRTNIKGAEIIDPNLVCVCGRSVKKLVWNQPRNSYLMEE